MTNQLPNVAAISAALTQKLEYFMSNDSQKSTSIITSTMASTTTNKVARGAATTSRASVEAEAKAADDRADLTLADIGLAAWHGIQ